jgi:DNA repair protein RadC
MAVLLLNTRRRVRGHQLVTIGTMDTALVHPREVFRVAVVGSAAAIVLMHNLCVAAHKLCYVERGVMCSCRLAGLALLGLSGRKECHGFA